MLGTLRRRYREVVEGWKERPDFIFYHEAFGEDLFVREEGGIKRVLWLHKIPPSTLAGTERLARAVDAIWCDRATWRDLFATRHPWIPATRLSVAPWMHGLCVEPDRSISAAVDEGGLRLGWVGELTLSGERADRLETLALTLKKQVELPWTLEICGSGDLRKSLSRRFADSGLKIEILPLNTWKERLPKWDAIVSVGRDLEWRVPYLAALEAGKSLWLPVDGDPAEVEDTEGPFPATVHLYTQGDLESVACSLQRYASTAPGPRKSKRSDPFWEAGAIDWTERLRVVGDLRVVAKRPLRPSGWWTYGWLRHLARGFAGEV